MRILLALIFILMVNLLLFSSQAAVTEIGIEEGVASPNFYTYDGSVLSAYDAGGYTLNENVTDLLPAGQAQVEPTTGVYLTDTFSVFKNWLLTHTGLNFVLGVLNAFPLFLKQIGLPVALAYALGAVWHGITLFLFILFLKGNV